jgi:hypothetical protein
LCGAFLPVVGRAAKGEPGLLGALFRVAVLAACANAPAEELREEHGWWIDRLK